MDEITLNIPIINDVNEIKQITHKTKEPHTIIAPDHLLDFPNTVYMAFKKLTLQYNSPHISLTAAEVFSLIIGLKYWSQNRGEVEIKPTITYFTRLLKVLKTKRFKEDHSDRYIIQH